MAAVFQKVVKELIDKDWLLPATANFNIQMGIWRFKDLFPAGMSDGRLVDFIVYQIYRFRDLIADKNSRWDITWCFSENAVRKFKAQFLDVGGKSGMLYYIDQWLIEGGLSRDKLERMIAVKKEHRLAKLIYIEAEDLTKRRFFGTETGFAICIKSTTGWTPKSPLCASCVSAGKCMEITEKKYPELTRLRKQDYDRR